MTTGLLAIGVAASVAIARAHVRARVALTLGLLGATAVLTGARAAGTILLPIDVWPSRGYSAVLTIGCVAAGVGLVRRTPWSRWLVLAFGGGGGVTGAMNLLAWARAPFGWDLPLARSVQYIRATSAAEVWTHIFLTTGATLLFALARGASMRDAFGKPFAANDPSTLWRSKHPLVSSVRLALTCGFAASAMCMLYAWGQPAVPATAGSSIALVLVFGLSAALTLARKTAGVMLLGVASVGFLVQSVATVALATEAAMSAAIFYSVVWTGAALAGLWAGVGLFRRARIV